MRKCLILVALTLAIFSFCSSHSHAEGKKHSYSSDLSPTEFPKLSELPEGYKLVQIPAVYETRREAKEYQHKRELIQKNPTVYREGLVIGPNTTILTKVIKEPPRVVLVNEWGATIYTWAGMTLKIETQQN